MHIFLILLATLISTSAFSNPLDSKDFKKKWDQIMMNGFERSIKTYGKARTTHDCQTVPNRCIGTVEYVDHTGVLMVLIETRDSDFKKTFSHEACELHEDRLRRDCYNIELDQNISYRFDAPSKQWVVIPTK